MHIALVGMSNIGKSYWARRLASEAGFERISCDERIEEKLAPELKKQAFSGLRQVAAWMGHPFDDRYDETSQTYSAVEQDVMDKVVQELRTSEAARSCVIDTTGSFIYCNPQTIADLKSLARIVYLEASPSHTENLFERYKTNPKPVIWDRFFNPQGSETPEETLKRCYPLLLDDRARRYAHIADILIPYQEHKKSRADLSVFRNVL